MKKHHEFAHAFDTIRNFNKIVELGDLCLTLLENKYIDGELIDPPETLEVLQGYIKKNCDRITVIDNNLTSYINGHPAFDLAAYTDKAQYTINTEKATVKTFSDTLSTSVLVPSITSLKKLTDISKTTSNPIIYAAPIQMYGTPQHWAITLNDLLDAASYVLRNINHNNGELTSYSEEQRRLMVRGFLIQFLNFGDMTYPKDLADEVKLMNDAADYVLGQLDATDLITIANYIDINVEKVPLMRRLWAIG